MINDRQGNTRLDDVKNEVSAFVHDVRLHGAPRVVTVPHFGYQQDERVYAYFHHTRWAEVKPSDWSAQEEGNLVITNQRFIFMASTHRQMYRISNIRDFSPCWGVNQGEIYVASSERRREYFLVPKAWLASAVLSLFWNELFRCELLDEEESVVVTKLMERIKKSSALYTVTVNSQGLKEYRVGGKTYIDTRGLSFAAGMKVSFEAGFQGKEILSDHDWNTGRAEAILRGEI